MKINFKSTINKIGFIIILTILTSSAYGQQHLWSTVKNDSIGEKYVPIDKATNEVLKVYDLYSFYYDLAGYTKERFIEEMSDDNNDWKWLNDINELTVFAFRSNDGKGSYITVMCVSKNNVNAIIFSNVMSGSFQMTTETDKEKFAKWFKTLLN